MSFQCPKCKKILKSRSGFKYHTKNVCKIIKENIVIPNTIPTPTNTTAIFRHNVENNKVIFNQSIKVKYLAELYTYEKYKHLEYSNKIILPQSILKKLMKTNQIQYPIIFNLKIKNLLNINVGVHEFVEGIDSIYLPYRILNSLNIKSGFNIELIYNFNKKKYKQGTIVKLQFHNTIFFDECKNFKEVLEQKLIHNYIFLQQDTVISINYNNKDYLINILQCKPDKFILINNTNLKIDFDKPLDFIKVQKEKQLKRKKILEQKQINRRNKELEIRYAEFKKLNGYIPFEGQGRRLGSN